MAHHLRPRRRPGMRPVSVAAQRRVMVPVHKRAARARFACETASTVAAAAGVAATVTVTVAREQRASTVLAAIVATISGGDGCIANGSAA